MVRTIKPSKTEALNASIVFQFHSGRQPHGSGNPERSFFCSPRRIRFS